MSPLLAQVERGSTPPDQFLLLPLLQRALDLLASEGWSHLDVFGIFLAVASRLLSLKAQWLLPQPVQEPCETPVTDHLLAEVLGQQLARLQERQGEILPCAIQGEGSGHGDLGGALTLAALLRAARKVFSSLPVAHRLGTDPLTPGEARLRVCARLSLGPLPVGELFQTCRDLLEAISLFLALLELVRLGECALRVVEEGVWVVPCPSLAAGTTPA